MYRPSNGFHYSVQSCEGCKGFFRRSIMTRAEYICRLGQNACNLTVGTERQRCQKCRLVACFQVSFTLTKSNSIQSNQVGNERKIRAEAKEPDAHADCPGQYATTERHCRVLFARATWAPRRGSVDLAKDYGLCEKCANCARADQQTCPANVWPGVVYHVV